MRSRGIDIATALTHAAAIGLLFGFATQASADSIAEKALPIPAVATAMPAVTETAAVIPVAAVPAAAMPAAISPTANATPAAVPAATVPATQPTDAQGPQPQQRGDRKMIFSYILLRGLQGAGPFSGR